VTKTEIIEAAFKVWGRDFYRKTSLSNLAKELGVSKPALYRHFENKQALVSSMTENFFDDFAASVRADFEQALQTPDADKGIFIIVKSIAGFFARNVYALLFALINIYDRNLDGSLISEQLKARGADMNTLRLVIEKKYNVNPALLQLIFASLTFSMSNFHRINESFENNTTGEKVQKIVSAIYKNIEHGLGYSIETAGSLDFEKLENQINGTLQSAEPEPLFKAVAEAVAEAGPWEASMEMVAKRMGLSKSSLYGHFKDRKDMLRRLFINEFKRIIEFARKGIDLSANTTEQLYLGIYSIAVYLRSRPEILIAMGWIRTRKLDLGKPNKDLEIFRLFEDVQIEGLHNATEEEKQMVSHWILFLLINVLTRPYLNNRDSKKEPHFVCSTENWQNDDLRMLYKFITLGLGGFVYK
jgi:AcrR family transcriptional regulator